MTLAPLLPVLLAASLSTGQAPPAAESLVLVVASNRGVRLDRAPLQYADDDGAKFHRVFAALAGDGNTILLTDFDADSARLFPSLAASAHSPTRANVDAAARQLAARSARARADGRSVRFYFVFAGHGDVDEGRGFLELADGPFTADQLQALIRTVGPTEAHVILDSCNSFFVVNPRKPGGRHFPTPRDAAESLARQLPNVGVFLSTSAQAEVYEWSELQSGVFSHAVRSGLMGAADVDHDGRVSYLELAAFVETAAADIKNPLYRPSVFARGPNGEDGRALLDLPRDARALLSVEEPVPVRLAARDRDGLRWLDAFAEADARLDLWFPLAIGGPLEIERLRTAGAATGSVERLYDLPLGPEPVKLAALSPVVSPLAARGAGEIFRALFTRPFGPAAFSAWMQERAIQPVPLLAPDGSGISGEPLPPTAAPNPTQDVRGSSYVALRAGAVLLTADAAMTAPGFDAALAVGREFNPILSGELSIGYSVKTGDPWPLSIPGETYASRGLPQVTVRYRVAPISMTARVALPFWRVHPYLLAGTGLAIANVTFDPADGNPTLRSTQLLPEIHAGLGVTYGLPGRWFTGAEARYSVARAAAFGHDFDLDGLRLAAAVGRGF